MAKRRKNINENTRNSCIRFRAYPDLEQIEMLAKTFGCCRKMWNYMLGEDQIDDKGRKYKPQDIKQLFGYMSECDKFAFDNVIFNYQDAWSRYWKLIKTQGKQYKKSALKRIKNGGKPLTNFDIKGHPQFKSKHSATDSYTTNVTNGNIRIKGNTIRIPKIGSIKIIKHQCPQPEWKIKKATITRTKTGKYYISVCFEFEKHIGKITQTTPYKVLGLDYSSPNLYKGSDGSSGDYPKYYRKSEEKLEKEQKKLSHQKLKSGRYKKQRLVVARLHEKVRHQRKDFLHKRSCSITKTFDFVVVEDLDLRNMGQCLRLGKATADNGFGMLRNFISYKLANKGGALIKIDKWFPSSQRCNGCGFVNNAVKDLNVREWECPQCNRLNERDENAAANIKQEGIRLLSTNGITLGDISGKGDSCRSRCQEATLLASKEVDFMVCRSPLRKQGV